MTDPTVGEREEHHCTEAPCPYWCLRPKGELLPTPAEPDAGDVEALANVLTDATRLYDWPSDQARHMLASGWLDAVRRKAGDERAEQIAHAIEAADPCEGSPVYDEAARIARESQ